MFSSTCPSTSSSLALGGGARGEPTAPGSLLAAGRPSPRTTELLALQSAPRTASGATRATM